MGCMSRDTELIFGEDILLGECKKFKEELMLECSSQQ